MKGKRDKNSGKQRSSHSSLVEILVCVLQFTFALVIREKAEYVNEDPKLHEK